MTDLEAQAREFMRWWFAKYGGQGDRDEASADMLAFARRVRAEALPLLQRIADAKDSREWWADLDRYLNTLAEAEPAP